MHSFRTRRLSVAGRFAFPILILLAAFAAAEPGSRDLVILHINDTHGCLFEPRAGEDDAPDRVAPVEGGAARLATLVRQIRAENPGNVLFLHAGDDLSSEDPVTVYYGGEATVQTMNALGLDAMTPGNGEFYGGVDRMLALRTNARYVLLAANLAYKASGGAILEPWIVREVNGVRVGILGLGFIRVNHPASKPLLLGDPVEAAKTYVPQLRAKADLVLLLTHIGEEQDLRIASEVPGVDIVVGGHTHTRMDPPRRVQGPDGREVVVAQAGDMYRYLGRLDVSVTPVEGQAARVEVQGKLIPVDDSVAEDPETAALLQSYLVPLERRIGEAAEDIPNPKTGDSPMVRLTGAAMQETASSDVVLLGRDDLNGGLKAGPVTLMDVVRLNPWRNRIVTVELTAAQLERLLSSGKLIAVGCSVETENGGTVLTRIGGKRPDPARSYLTAMTDYLYGTTPDLEDVPATVTDLRLDLVLREYVQKAKRLRSP
ncbi:MAG: Bifunctional metallophosphatase/5-nucleotidase [Candidatus Hydrogenedentes bacterium]|nr:Bifunctional metallophosphatase/5-nucleotidase [Candidatus Hydrogenedentota bacterium]